MEMKQEEADEKYLTVLYLTLSYSTYLRRLLLPDHRPHWDLFECENRSKRRMSYVLSIVSPVFLPRLALLVAVPRRVSSVLLPHLV